MGGLWTYWTWYHAQIIVPSTAPVNVTTEVSVKTAGPKEIANGGNRALEGIELSVSARNPSVRDIYLLSNYWVAYGLKVTPRQESNDDWLPEAIKRINTQSGSTGGRHYENQSQYLVAVNNVFDDSILHPEEQISRSYVFYVEQGAYDYLEVIVYLPTTTAAHPTKYGYGGLEVEYKYKLGEGSPPEIETVYYRVNADNTRDPLTIASDGSFLESDSRTYGIQSAGSVVDMPLGTKTSPQAND